MNFEIHHRPRRLRDHPVLNSMITETSMSTDDLVLPVFLTEEGESPEPISSMPEIFRWPIGVLVEKLEEWKALGIKCFAVFPHITHSKKDPMGDEILNPSSLAYRAAR